MLSSGFPILPEPSTFAAPIDTVYKYGQRHGSQQKQNRLKVLGIPKKLRDLRFLLKMLLYVPLILRKLNAYYLKL